MKLIAMAVLLLAATMVLGWFASPSVGTVAGLPGLVILFASIFAVQWLGFFHAWLYNTEHYFDLLGSLSFAGAAIAALWWSSGGLVATLLLCMVVIWALRLGSFLFLRIREVGEDQRFRKIKRSPARFFLVWNLQGLWISLTSSAALTAMLGGVSEPIEIVSIIGVLMWCTGLLFEAMADYQKTQFRRDPAKAQRFIASGLWSICQHPNYSGEILLWWGVAVTALPTFSGGQWLTLISPIFVVLLLTRISGIPSLAAKAARQWGDDPEYQAYVAVTPRLIPRWPTARGASD